MLRELWGLFSVGFRKMNFDDERCLNEIQGVSEEGRGRRWRGGKMIIDF